MNKNNDIEVNVAVNSKSHLSITMLPQKVLFSEFAQSMSVCRQGGKYEGYFIRGGEMVITSADETKRNPECHKDHYHRNDKSLLSADLLILDADGSVGDMHSAPDGGLISACLREMNVRHFIYSTHSHKYNGKGNRYRVVIPCRMDSKEQLRSTVNKIIGEIREHGVPLGDVKEAKAWSQPWFFPTRKNPDDNRFEYYDYLDSNSKSYQAATIQENKDGDIKTDGDNASGNNISDSNSNASATRPIGEIISVITSGGEGLHHAINDYLYGMIKDGVAKSSAIASVKGLMQACPGDVKESSRWSDRMGEIERSAEGAYDRVKSDTESSSGSVADIVLSAKSAIEKYRHMRVLSPPKYPHGFMSTWPEPWGDIWSNWSRMPAKLSESLLVPTILSFHGFLLQGKYLNERLRRPNLYQLNLAESTAYKDTNSKDVLRSLSRAMASKGIFNSIFDNLSACDSNISSDTALLKMLGESDGKLYWINTEATRVFQMLSGGGAINSSVMALADKMIEIVDGYEITGKVKAGERVGGISDPNIQIIFYAQPETIERHINTEMIDSGFLGRALITLDMTEEDEPRLFNRMESLHGVLSDDLAGFYSGISINSISERFICKLPDAEFEKACKFESEVVQPLITGEGAAGSSADAASMRKMLTRIGNSAEQLYAIVLGICREWDISQGVVPRESIDFNCLVPLLTFWTESKHYVVKEFIVGSGDILSSAIEETIIDFLDGTRKLPAKYSNLVSIGQVPRSLIVNSIRGQKRLARMLGPQVSSQMTYRCSQSLDTMVRNEILVESEVKLSQRKMKVVGFKR